MISRQNLNPTTIPGANYYFVFRVFCAIKRCQIMYERDKHILWFYCHKIFIVVKLEYNLQSCRDVATALRTLPWIKMAAVIKLLYSEIIWVYWSPAVRQSAVGAVSSPVAPDVAVPVSWVRCLSEDCTELDRRGFWYFTGASVKQRNWFPWWPVGYVLHVSSLMLSCCFWVKLIATRGSDL